MYHDPSYLDQDKEILVKDNLGNLKHSLKMN